MGGKDDAPAAPDFTPIAQASEQAANLEFQSSQNSLAWAKEQYADTSAITNKVVDSALSTQDANNAAAAQDRARYTSEFQPLEDQLVNDANSYASGARKDQQMGAAAAQVGNQFTQQRQAAQQNLESFGVDPTSTRFAALDIGTRTSQAAAQAASANQASQQVDAQGRALRSEAINVGRGYPGQIAQTYGTSLAAGNQAENSSLSNVASGANTMGTATQWQGLGNQSLGVWGNTLQMGYQDELSSYNANQSSSSGIGSALGLIGGLATAFEDGGAVPDQGAIPPAPGATTGGAIPTSASPSGGANVDDVNARLNAGEFVMPKDVTSWFGEEKLQKMIEKARKDASQAGAQPQQKPALNAPPAFISHPVAQQAVAQTAIPMR